MMSEPTDPLELLRLRQASNRLNYAESTVQQRKKATQQSPEFRYVGHDADQDQHLIEDDSGNIVPAFKNNTNGLILPGQRVKTANVKSYTSIDQRSKPKPQPIEKPKRTIKASKLKILYSVQDEESLSVYVKGNITKPILIATLPANTEILLGTVASLGDKAEDYRAGFLSKVGDVWTIYDLSAIEYTYSSLEYPGIKNGLDCLGHGFWVGTKEVSENSVIKQAFSDGQVSEYRYNFVGTGIEGDFIVFPPNVTRKGTAAHPIDGDNFFSAIFLDADAELMFANYITGPVGGSEEETSPLAGRYLTDGINDGAVFINTASQTLDDVRYTTIDDRVFYTTAIEFGKPNIQEPFYTNAGTVEIRAYEIQQPNVQRKAFLVQTAEFSIEVQSLNTEESDTTIHAMSYRP